MNTNDIQPNHNLNNADFPPAPSEASQKAVSTTEDANMTETNDATMARKPSYTELRDCLNFMLNQTGHLEEDYPGEYDFSNEREVSNQADATESETPEHLFRRAVALRIVYWDTVRALEKAVAEDGDFTDRQNDQVNDLIDNLAAGASTGLTLEEAYDSVGEENFSDLTDILSRD